jgi:hypothetical protein
MEQNDWAGLFRKYASNKVDYDKHKHLFTKVAFDVFQMNSSPVDALWTLEDGEDGKQYLVATYDEDTTLKTESAWKTIANKEASAITLFYKDCPVHKFASSEYGFCKDDAHLFERLILSKASDSGFVKSMLASEPDKAESILALFPELR